jgi:hypothetical protein
LIAVSGVGQGEALQVGWPPGEGFMTAQRNVAKGDFRNDLLAFACALLPDAMVGLAMREVERAASTPMPVAERPARIAALEVEIERLQRIEECLVVRDGGEREANRPAAVVLSVRLAVEARGGKVAA